MTLFPDTPKGLCEQRLLRRLGMTAAIGIRLFGCLKLSRAESCDA
jgi:hypothetical protein